MMERRGFLAFLAMLLGLPRGWWQPAGAETTAYSNLEDLWWVYDQYDDCYLGWDAVTDASPWSDAEMIVEFWDGRRWIEAGRCKASVGEFTFKAPGAHDLRVRVGAAAG